MINIIFFIFNILFIFLGGVFGRAYAICSSDLLSFIYGGLLFAPLAYFISKIIVVKVYKEHILTKRIQTSLKFLSIIFFLIGLFPIEGKCIFFPTISTEFTRDFRDAKFKKINIGMTKLEVLTTIGEPFDKNITNTPLKDNKSIDSIWCYSRDYGLLDFAWKGYLVTFKDNKVVDKKIYWRYD